VAKSNLDTDSSVTMLQEATQEVGRMAEQLRKMAGQFQVETKGETGDSGGKRKGAGVALTEGIPVHAGAD
jgi:hypothetical protein